MTRLCPHCKLPVEPGDLRYTGREPEETWHAHCYADQRPDHTNLSDLRAKMATITENLDQSIQRLRLARSQRR